MFLSELNKSEVFFGISRKLIERYVDIDLFKIFSIKIVLFYETRSTDLGSDDVRFMPKISKTSEIM